jgi:membrane-associated protease RseP (regulator of RpoE activity)
MRRSALLIAAVILAGLAGAVLVGRLQHPQPVIEPVAQPGPVKRSSERRPPPAPARDASDVGEPPARVRIQEVSPGRYEVRGTAVRALLDNAGGGLSDLALTVMPLPSFETGMQLRISSVVGDGVLTAEGFTVTDPKLAGAAGIQAGDTIVKINGAPVGGSLAGLLAMRRDPDQRTIVVELDRRGMKLIQTYQIR